MLTPPLRVLLPLTVSIPVPACSKTPVPDTLLVRLNALADTNWIVPLLMIWLPVTPTWSLL